MSGCNDNKFAVQSCVLKVLKRIDEDDVITVILKSDGFCCAWTGCFCRIENNTLVLFNPELAFDEGLINGESCRKMYIPLDCICAIINPGFDGDENGNGNGDGEVCGCFVTAGGVILENDEPIGNLQRFNVCPSCTINGSGITYVDDVEEITFSYSNNPPVGSLISSQCLIVSEDLKIATITARGEVEDTDNDEIIGEDCLFTIVLEQNPTTEPDRIISVSITCDSEFEYNKSNLELQGQSPIEIRPCIDAESYN
ncbi:hypothetical protein [Selenihalanaerobacter shriftii]|uniref:Uncharacterized protein n=1 Tax=Selenihalanaerobacter shriftii TaxID=142842 RepID=A0A1T4K837_9FIRM|nr:hypothetical protein [Selenihalanaerobacter shriftii]SJZ38610.1 hypothetical protein SAMN02745118_00679 [Selenihalanaerobacter shriftii]